MTAYEQIRVRAAMVYCFRGPGLCRIQCYIVICRHGAISSQM